jgi:hypothetical protein
MIDSNNSLLHSITVPNVISHLIQKGWTRDSNLVLEKLQIFKGPMGDSGKALELRVPKRNDFIDYYERIADIVNLISLIDDVSVEQVISDIKSCFLDSLGVRVIETGEYEDSLSIEEAYKDISGLRNLIIYSACSEKHPSKHFDTPGAIGHKHSRSCRFGHTFRGSFGFTIESPLMSNEAENFELIEPPFERRVIERIARGLAITKIALKENNPDLLVESYEKAFNSKMCEALLKFSYSDIELSFNWSKEVLLSEDIVRGEKYFLSKGDFKVLEYAASKLKEVDPIETVVMGKIINLHCTTSPEEEENNRSIVVKYVHEGKGIEVKAILNKTDYIDACTAHVEGRIVSIFGELQRKGSEWEVLNISKFLSN